MLAAKFVALLSAVTAAVSAPVKRAAEGQANIDTVILNYALTLEHLENAFYNQMPSADAFREAGFPSFVRERFVQIGSHESSHVDFLTKALGDDAVAACEYDFGNIADVPTFIATSVLLEGVGVSAYAGAAQNITSPAYLTAAATVLSTEARHSAWVQSVAAKKSPAAAAYDTPTNFNQTYSLAAPLIKSCPDSNAKLPVVAFPAATVSPAAPAIGAEITVSSDKLEDGQKLALIGPGATKIVDLQNGKTTLPENLTGRVYGVIVQGDAKEVTDDTTVAGPFVLDLFYPSASAAAQAVSDDN